eukprot:2080058-Pleurochrysis_carterae.AAC.1
MARASLALRNDERDRMHRTRQADRVEDRNTPFEGCIEWQGSVWGSPRATASQLLKQKTRMRESKRPGERTNVKQQARSVPTHAEPLT